MDYLALVEHVAAVVGAVVMAASAYCARTDTPDPTTLRGKLYHGVEMLALVVGKAKQMGVMPSDPAAERLGTDAAQVVKDVLGKAAILGLVVAAGIGLSACAQVQQAEQWAPSFVPAADQPQLATDTAKIEAGIVKACLGSGLFKLADGMVAAAVPVAGLPVQVVNAGIDLVCADPARFAADAGTVAWLAKNLASLPR